MWTQYRNGTASPEDCAGGGAVWNGTDGMAGNAISPQPECKSPPRGYGALLTNKLINRSKTYTCEIFGFKVIKQTWKGKVFHWVQRICPVFVHKWKGTSPETTFFFFTDTSIFQFSCIIQSPPVLPLCPSSWLDRSACIIKDVERAVFTVSWRSCSFVFTHCRETQLLHVLGCEGLWKVTQTARESSVYKPWELLVPNNTDIICSVQWYNVQPFTLYTLTVRGSLAYSVVSLSFIYVQLLVFPVFLHFTVCIWCNFHLIFLI